MDSLQFRHNFSAPPTSQSSAVENYPSNDIDQKHKKGMSPGGVAFLVCGLALLATCAALFIAFRVNHACVERRNSLESTSTMHSLPISTARGEVSYLRIFILPELVELFLAHGTLEPFYVSL